MSLKVSIKIPAIPELNTDNLSKQHLEPVWRSAANGVATAVKTHFLSLGGDRFWGEASEKVRVVPLSRNRWQIGVYQRGVRLQYQGGTVKPTGKPSEVTGKPTKSIFIPRQDGPISREGESVFPGNVRFRLLSRNPKITRHKNGTEDYEFDVEEA